MLVRNERIVRVFAFADGGQHETFRQIHRHVFQRMHGEVGAPVFQRGFQLLHEQTLAADLGQRHIENLVALGGHAQYADLDLRI